MKTSSSKPTITKKYSIEVPTHQYMSKPTVFKIWFGKKYLIWKGKSLLQSCQLIAESIERNIRLQKNDDTDYLHHVCNYVKRTKIGSNATVEVISNDYEKTRLDSVSIDGYKMLIDEQRLLDKAKNDPDCLNNNAIAYVSGWIKDAHKEKFELFLLKKKR